MKRSLCLLAVCAACTTPSGVPDAGVPVDAGQRVPDSGMPSNDDGGFGHVVSFTPPTPVDPLLLGGPIDDAGVMHIVRGPGYTLGYVRPTPGPMTAFTACTDWISLCLSPTRSFDDCARSVPTCQTQTPWNESACCAAACFQRYVTERQSGTGDEDAYFKVYFDKANNCMPGVSDIVRTTP